MDLLVLEKTKESIQVDFIIKFQSFFSEDSFNNDFLQMCKKSGKRKIKCHFMLDYWALLMKQTSSDDVYTSSQYLNREINVQITELFY